MVARGWQARPTSAVARPRRVDLRFTDADVAQLVTDYEAGCTGRQLAETYGVARSTVVQLLKEHGVAVRRPRIKPEEIEQAVAWYRGGVRQIEIAEWLGRSKSVVWHSLKRAGAL